VPAIADYIVDRRAFGLHGCLLALAGDAIWRSHGGPSAAAAKSWATSHEWARRYLT
jgi:hypothetical protein